MKLAVQGLWHLGCVTAAGCAKAGHQVCGLAETPGEAEVLGKAWAPLQEPGLNELLAEGLQAGRLSFTADPAQALKGAELLWVAYDTPVDEEDRADAAFVLDRVKAVLPHLDQGCLILVSSQIPVGSCAELAKAAESARPGAGIQVACSPENLRLGSALKVFLEPDRVVLGCGPASRSKLEALFKPITARLEWMSVASAEMTKHALNSFLASSVVFANEIARVCEQVGADAAEVARGLKTDQRIGAKAYVSPGAAFAGGTLARDLGHLAALDGGGFFSAALASNRRHAHWPEEALKRLLGPVAGKQVALIGLAYKPGTDALRRSPALELAAWLKGQGAQVRGWDALVKSLPADAPLTLSSSGEAAVAGVSAVVLFHRWDGLAKALFPAGQRAPALVDPMGLAEEAARELCPRYARVGWVAGGKA